jgi:hypothetical protein
MLFLKEEDICGFAKTAINPITTIGRYAGRVGKIDY